jgi:hypothetical protein
MGMGSGRRATLPLGVMCLPLDNLLARKPREGREKRRRKGREKLDRRGPYLRKTSLPSLGIAEGSRTFVSLLGREKEKEGAKLAKAPGKGKEKEKNKDWMSALASVGTKSNRDKDKSFGMGLAIPRMGKGRASNQIRERRGTPLSPHFQR